MNDRLITAQLIDDIMSTVEVVERRRCRKTRTTVALVIVDNVPFTLCDEHGSMTDHPSRRLAREWLADPTVWCSQCGNNHDPSR